MKAYRAGRVIAAGAIVFLLVIAGRAQSPAGDAVLMPANYRPPIALIVTAPGAAISLPERLQSNGIASLREMPEGDATEPTSETRVRQIVDRLVRLRNDARFPIMIVVAYGSLAADAAIAARLGRADGFVSIGADADASVLTGLTKLLVAPSRSFKSEADAAAAEVAQFVNSLPPLGYRGGRDERPTTPRRSPRAVAIAKVGGEMAGIEYGSPQKRGRTIWGGLVPWNRVWMPGADEATTLATSAYLRIGDVTLPPGDHTLYVDPREDRVQLLFSSDVGVFHTYYNSQSVIGRADMSLTRLSDAVEGLTFGIESKGSEAGAITLSWDDRSYRVSYTVLPRRIDLSESEDGRRAGLEKHQ